ncbi:MAG: hypothetical protein FJY21_12990, partial [Bacteroidetes bacterium]|nr:hypothetical protein [Bacteroidota bacterium]
SPMEQNLYQVSIGKDYPQPIVNLELSRKAASDIVWSFRKNEGVKKEATRILKKHVNTSGRLKSKRKVLKQDARS